MLFLDGVDDKRYGQDNDYIYQNTIDKLTILDKNLNAEKEFTSGPLFDEYTTVKVKSAVKTLKVESVDTLYSGGYGSDYFYDYYSWRIYNEETGSYEWYHYYELLAHFTEDEVRNYVEGYIKLKGILKRKIIMKPHSLESASCLKVMM